MQASARAEVVRIAKAMISGEMSLVDGARMIVVFRNQVDPDLENQAFLRIYGFESETEDLLVGISRERYSQEYVARTDAKVNAYVEESRPAIIEACRQLCEDLIKK